MKNKESTGYFDRNGKEVFVGDKIEFCFWMPGSGGTPYEKFFIGRIRKRKGHLVFAFKQSDGYLSEYRLSALHFDSQSDWEILTK